MTQSTKNVVSGVWIGSLVTFAVTACYLIANERNIDVSGEMSEALAGVGIPLFALLLLVSTVVLFVSRKKK